MLPRRPAQRPQSILEPLGEGDEALAAEHDMGMGETRVSQPEVIETVIERGTRDCDAQCVHVGEIRQAPIARRVSLTEDHLLFRAAPRAPGAHAPFDGATDPRRQIRVSTAHLLEYSHGAQRGRGFQQRANVGLEQFPQRIGPASAARGLLLRG